MQDWPWSATDRDWFTARLRQKRGIPDALTRRFLWQFASGRLKPQPECRVSLCRRNEPVANLRTWAGMHTFDALAAHVRTAEDAGYVLWRQRSRWAVFLFADRLVGWRPGRGIPVIRRRGRRAKRPWKGLRIK